MFLYLHSPGLDDSGLCLGGWGINNKGQKKDPALFFLTSNPSLYLLLRKENGPRIPSDATICPCFFFNLLEVQRSEDREVLS